MESVTAPPSAPASATPASATPEGPRPALLVLSQGGLETARRIKAAFPNLEVQTRAARVAPGETTFAETGAQLRQLFQTIHHRRAGGWAIPTTPNPSWPPCWPARR